MDEIKSWVAEKPTFTRYLYLNWMYRRLRKNDLAAETLENALGFPPWKPHEFHPDDGQHLVLTTETMVAIIKAYRAGHKDVAAKAIQHLLDARDEAKIFVGLNSPMRELLEALADSHDAGQLDIELISSFTGRLDSWSPFYGRRIPYTDAEGCDFDTSEDLSGADIE